MLAQLLAAVMTLGTTVLSWSASGNQGPHSAGQLLIEDPVNDATSKHLSPELDIEALYYAQSTPDQLQLTMQLSANPTHSSGTYLVWFYLGDGNQYYAAYEPAGGRFTYGVRQRNWEVLSEGPVELGQALPASHVDESGRVTWVLPIEQLPGADACSVARFVFGESFHAANPLGPSPLPAALTQLMAADRTRPRDMPLSVSSTLAIERSVTE